MDEPLYEEFVDPVITEDLEGLGFNCEPGQHFHNFSPKKVYHLLGIKNLPNIGLNLIKINSNIIVKIDSEPYNAYYHNILTKINQNEIVPSVKDYLMKHGYIESV